MDLRVAFPGGKKVDALYQGFTIRTDQPEKAGGDGSAPSPFALFLASLGTCAGYYILNFCQTRNIPAHNIELVLRPQRNPKKGLVDKFNIEIKLPPDFPRKYVSAVKSAADKCTVKKVMVNNPTFEITTTGHQ
ncbi:MAG: OsmC family protein [Spirochaetota bacterium]